VNSEELQDAYSPSNLSWQPPPEMAEKQKEYDDHISRLLAKVDERNSFERVREFHKKFGHPVADKPTVIEDDRTALRLALIFEEALELADAMGFFTGEAAETIERMLSHGPVVDANLVATADALGDLEYVTNGAALEMGINLPKVVREIHRSNMTKLGPDGKPVYREDGKILKGEGYEPPNLEEVLGL